MSFFLYFCNHFLKNASFTQDNQGNQGKLRGVKGNQRELREVKKSQEESRGVERSQEELRGVKRSQETTRRVKIILDLISFTQDTQRKAKGN